MKRFSLVMMCVALVVCGLLVGCDIPTGVSSALTTGASTIVGALMTWAFEAASGNTASTTTVKMISDMIAMIWVP
jgi:hypothetical protein